MNSNHWKQALILLTLALAATLTLCLKAAEPNTLTEAEKKAGWKLLFDGKTTAGWRGYKMDKMPPGWSVIDGVLVRVKGGAGGKGAGGGDDIVTTEEFENFDLQLEWKTVPSGNSGVLYHVSEEPVTSWHYAPEVQILDNTAHPTRDKRQLAAACYDLYAPSKDMTRPLGEWNQMRVLVNGAHVEHWLNGEKVVEYELWSDDWKQRVANSKHKEHPKFGTFKKGPIALQDHTDRLEFRNIKIRVLPGKQSASASSGALFLQQNAPNFVRASLLELDSPHPPVGHPLPSDGRGRGEGSVASARGISASSIGDTIPELTSFRAGNSMALGNRLWSRNA